MTVISDEISVDAQETVPSPVTESGDPLSMFLPEPQNTNGASADNVAMPVEAMQAREGSAPFVTPKTSSATDRTTELVNHLKRALGALDIARDLTKAVDSRFAALKNLEQEIQDRGDALESLKQGILESAAQADDVVRSITWFEPRLAGLREKEEGLRAVETVVAAFEERAQTVTADLERHVGACEAREALVVQEVEQLGRRAAGTIADLEGHVADCEARAHTAQETVAHLQDVSARTLPELQERLKEADEKHRGIDQKIVEAAHIATSFAALELRLPRIAQSDQELARIELVVPKVEGRLEDLNDSIEQQIRTLAGNQQLVQQTLDEAHKSATAISELENRIAELSRSHQRLDGVEQRVEQLEARAAAAVSEFTQAARAKNDLEQEFAALQDQFRQTTEAADGEAKKLVEFTERAKRYQHEQAQKASAVLSTLESQLADVSSSQQLLARVEEQLGELGARHAAAAAEVKQATGAKNGLEQEFVELQNHLRRMTQRADDEAKKLIDLRQQGERHQQEQAQKASAVLSAIETRMAGVHRGQQLLDRIEQQLGQLEARAAAAAAEVTQTADAKNALEREVVTLQNHLQQMTKAAGDEAKTLVDLRQQTERYQREETHKVSAVLSGLETRLADLDRNHQKLSAVDRQVGQLEQRSAAATAEVKQATRAKNALQEEVAELQNQLQRLTKDAQGEAKKLVELTREAERRPRVTQADLSRNRQRSVGVAVALVAVVVVLVGSVWRFSRAEGDRAASPPPPPVLASRTIGFTPIESMALLTPATLIGNEGPDNKRPAPVEPPVPVVQVAVSSPAVQTSGKETAPVRPQALGTPGERAQFVGTLVIESEPAGATAFVNQRSVGETPVVLKDLRAGSYVVRVESEGYERWSTAVTVSTIQEAHVSARLQRLDIRR